MDTKQTVIDLFAKGENRKLEEFVLTSLGNLRGRFLEHLDTLMPELEGKIRLKLLEILMSDGGNDLIPLYIDCIRKEKNMLYAKSMILLFREFKHQRALTALLSIEHEVQADLKGTYQRALGKLLSRFSEQFYMSEFRAGLGDRRRVKFAVDMMLRSNHPEYVPFLNQQILINDMGFRTEGLRALGELGDASSKGPLFSLMTKLRIQHQQKHMKPAIADQHDPHIKWYRIGFQRNRGRQTHAVCQRRDRNGSALQASL